MRPYQVMFGGRMPNMTEENWLTVMERKTAKLQNEDGQLDDEDSINLQSRLERSSIGEPIGGTDSLPGSRVRRITANTFTSGATSINFEHTRDFMTPSRIPLHSGTASSSHINVDASSSSRSLSQSKTSKSQTPSAREKMDRQMALRLQKVLDREESNDDVFESTRPRSSVFSEFSGFSDDDARDDANNNADDSSADDSPTTSESQSPDQSNTSSRLRNRPPGASKDYGIDVTTIKA